MMPSQSMSQEEFVSRCKKHEFYQYHDITNIIYKNIRTDIEILCKIHGKFKISPLSFMNGDGCGICGKITGLFSKSRLSLEEYKVKLIRISYNREFELIKILENDILDKNNYLSDTPFNQYLDEDLKCGEENYHLRVYV